MKKNIKDEKNFSLREMLIIVFIALIMSLSISEYFNSKDVDQKIDEMCDYNKPFRGNTRYVFCIDGQNDSEVKQKLFTLSIQEHW